MSYCVKFAYFIIVSNTQYELRNRCLPFYLRHQLYFPQHALDAEALEELALVNEVFALRVDGPGVLLPLLLRAARGFHQLKNDVLEGVNVVVEQEDSPRRLNSRFVCRLR